MVELLQAFEWRSILLGEEKWDFLLETAFRTVIMFLVILLSLRLLGKRGIKQLSVFELGVIIGLGSAAGDPMFYRDVGLLPGVIVFIMVIVLYRLITMLINRFQRFEQFVEGKPKCLVRDGCFEVRNMRDEPFAADEIYSQLRLNHVSHLGQVQQAILETNGEVSIFFYADDQVRYGLPILPELLEEKYKVIPSEGHYACSCCGFHVHAQPG
ncbi:MAG TPA: YetF domain-containing protein, partial [Flavisolibacter sp.]